MLVINKDIGRVSFFSRQLLSTIHAVAENSGRKSYSESSWIYCSCQEWSGYCFTSCSKLSTTFHQEASCTERT